MKKLVFDGKLLKLFVEKKTMPHGFVLNMEYIKHPGAVAVVPFLSRDTIVLIKQYRPVISRYIFEIPAGTLDNGEGLLHCVKREMIEEIGYRAKRIEKLGAIYTTPGFTTERIHIFKATGLSFVGRRHEPDECIETVKTRVSSLPAMVARGKIIDSKTVAGLALCGLI